MAGIGTTGAVKSGDGDRSRPRLATELGAADGQKSGGGSNRGGE